VARAPALPRIDSLLPVPRQSHGQPEEAAVTATEARKKLKEKGWKRHDRNGGERWTPPWNGLGFEPMSVTLETARRRLRKELKK
jgi:hypothetical protein